MKAWNQQKYILEGNHRLKDGSDALWLSVMLAIEATF